MLTSETRLTSCTKSFTVIVATFHSALTIQTWLESLPYDFAIIVVDQNSSDHTIAFALSARPHIHIIQNLVNTGFSAGCNAGAARANNATLLFLNPDASFPSTGDAGKIAALRVDTF
jgi:GT2 family glycosyltransferase